MGDETKTNESQTELLAQKEVQKEKLKLAFPDGIIGIFLDFIDLEDTIKKEYAAANAQDRKKFIRWFAMGLVFMFSSMLAALIGLALWEMIGIEEFIWFMAKFIFGTAASLLLGYVVSKVKDQISIDVKNDRNYLEKLLKSVVTKLTYMK